jgi:hypothetical protein
MLLAVQIKIELVVFLGIRTGMSWTQPAHSGTVTVTPGPVSVGLGASESESVRHGHESPEMTVCTAVQRSLG